MFRTPYKAGIVASSVKVSDGEIRIRCMADPIVWAIDFNP
jgi:hypothetical protein